MRVLKWPVPVDGHQHLIGPGKVLHVAHQGEATEVYVWTEEPGDGTAVTPTRPAVVIGTGHTVPDSSVHLGSTVIAAVSEGPSWRTPVSLVWHLYAEVQD